MKKKQDTYPKGWDGDRVREIVTHYENQSEDAALAEHEAALGRPERTRMEVPVDLVPTIRQMIADHEDKRDVR